MRARVKDIPGESDGVSGAEMASVVRKGDELLGVGPADKSHLFCEKMKRLFHAMREIEPEDVGRRVARPVHGRRRSTLERHPRHRNET